MRSQFQYIQWLNNGKINKKHTRMKKEKHHKYVFEDGKFIGDFDNMYKNCDDPWGLDKKHNEQIDYDLIACFVSYLKRINKLEKPKILEIGSGKGYFCNAISNMGEVTGLEISQHAVNIAKERFLNCDFRVGNIMDDNVHLTANLINKSYDFVIMFKGMVWYVIDKVESVFQRICWLLKDDGIAIIAVNYYRGDYYGKNIISSKDDFTSLIQEEFEILNVFDEYSKESGLDFKERSYFILKKGN